MNLLAVLGAAPEGARLQRIERSLNFRDGKFQNPVETTMMAGSTLAMLREQFFGRQKRVPRASIPVAPLMRESFDDPPESGLRVTWFGHSTVLLEIDGYRVLVDPVWGKRASPYQFVGPKRFHPVPLALEDLPPLDVVIITHDHYDHLDMTALRRLTRLPRQQRVHLITALGVGAHFERWGIDPSHFTELDWGDTAHVGALRITATPARHFSGRGFDRNRTLWASWVIAGAEHRVFHSGDTGYFDGIADIGAQHGPFDLTMVKIGAYDAHWPDIHLNPEQAVRVHDLLKGRVMLPIHWGTFNLAMHAWDEPAERVIVAAASAGAKVVLPRPGEQVEPASPPELRAWWRDVP